MNCPYSFVFYNKNTMPLSFRPHLWETLSYFPPSPPPSPVKGEGNRRVHLGGTLSFLPPPSRGRIEVGAGSRSELFTYDNITK